MYIEPNADIKTSAATFRQFYNAFMEVGFSEAQSFEIICKLAVAAMSNQKND